MNLSGKRRPISSVYSEETNETQLYVSKGKNQEACISSQKLKIHISVGLTCKHCMFEYKSLGSWTQKWYLPGPGK